MKFVQAQLRVFLAELPQNMQNVQRLALCYEPQLGSVQVLLVNDMASLTKPEVK